jgi:uncharacterized protein (TIGR02246 family)
MPLLSPLAAWTLAAIALVVVAVLHDPASAAASPSCVETSRSEISSLIERWHLAIDSGNSDRLDDLYADDAVLLSATSAAPRVGKREIQSFFSEFLERHPKLTVTIRSVVAGCEMASEMGTISYRITGRRKGTHMLIEGRTTTVFAQREGRWLIVQQSLSLLTRPNRAATPAY